MRTRGMRIVVGLAVVLLSISTPQVAGAAEEGTVKATAAWVGQGRFIPTGNNTAFFVGTFSGILFVENDQGALHAGKIMCPGTLQVDFNSGKQQGEGRCVIADAKGSQVYARWTCAGTHLLGCRGRFELTGGSGRFKGITGQSDFRIRSGLAELALTSESLSVQESAAGLAEWPSLTYRIP